MKNFIRRSCMYFVVLFLVLGVALFVPSPSVFASPNTQSANGNLTVTALVLPSCAITNTSLDFGLYDIVSGAAVNGSAYINVICTNGAPYSITLDSGQANGNQANIGTSAYAMGNGLNDWLGYDFFTTPNSQGLVVPNLTDIAGGNGQGNGLHQNIPIYGRIAAGQTTIPSGNYADTVAITIHY